MSKISTINKLAEIYFNRSIIKKARIIDNMAARILWSTIPYNQQINHIPALYSLYHGAKEYLKYGAMAIIDELKYEKNIDDAIKAYSNCLTDFFNIAAKSFYSDRKWGNPLYGGKVWSNVSKRFAEMSAELDMAEKTKGKPEFIQHMNNVIVYMNVIDGMIHNSGNLLNKIIDQEFKENEKGLKEIIDYKNKVTGLMDAKELKNTDDVMNYAANIIKDVPERYLPFKDWIFKRKYESSYEPQQQSLQEKERELNLIRVRKLIKQDLLFIRENINKIKDFAFNQHEKWRYLANIMMSLKQISENFIKYKLDVLPDLNIIIKKIDDVIYRHSDWLEDEQFCENFGTEIESVYYKLRDL